MQYQVLQCRMKPCGATRLPTWVITCGSARAPKPVTATGHLGARARADPVKTSRLVRSQTSGVVFFFPSASGPGRSHQRRNTLDKNVRWPPYTSAKYQKAKSLRNLLAHKAASTINQPRPQPCQNHDFPTQNLREYTNAKNPAPEMANNLI